MYILIYKNKSLFMPFLNSLFSTYKITDTRNVLPFIMAIFKYAQKWERLSYEDS